MEIPKPKPPVKPLAEAPKKKAPVRRPNPQQKVRKQKQAKEHTVTEHLMQRPFDHEALINFKNSLNGGQDEQ